MNQLLPALTTTEANELIDFVPALRDGSLTDAQLVRLEELVCRRKDGPWTYLQAANLVAGLQWRLASEKLLADRAELCAASAEIRAPKLVGQVEPPSSEFTTVRQTSTSVPLSLLGSKRNPFFLVGCTALVALCVYGSFVLIAWNLRPDKLPNFATGSSDSVAVVRDTTDVQWVSKSAESSVLPGEPLQIKSGTIELELKAGTKLVIEGPADWSIDGDNRATLRSGKLTAQVPSQAIGFTVETPTSRIIDLGTEFEVEVSPSGVTEVQVTKGKVELYPDVKRDTDSSAQPRKITLPAGTARRVEISAAGEITVREIAHKLPRLSPAVGSNGTGRLPIYGALASSESSDQHAKSLIDESGLRGDRHSNAPDDTMWRSAPGRVKGEFVLFDVGRPSRLDSMKVWNYNDAHATLQGVTHADIYVSVSGKRDPLREPGEWKRVVTNFKFARANGTSDYDTPDVIPLGNSKARFVAMVILDQRGPNATGIPPSKDWVGLSEVQFFGARLTTINGDINGVNPAHGPGPTFTGVGAAGGGLWNTINASGSNPATASGTNLVASNGTATSVDFTATGALNHGDIGTRDAKSLNALLNDYLFTSDASDFTVGTFKFSGLTVGGVYDVYLYGSAGNYNQRSIFSIPGYGSQTESFGSSSATTTIVPVGDLNLTYVKFVNVVADANGEINGSWTNNPGFFAGPFNGFQLVFVERP